MRVLIACEFSGIVRDAFAAKGNDAVSCDLLPTEKPGAHYQGDVFDIIDYGWDLMIAHPPCTYLSLNGARWDKVRPEREVMRLDALRFFEAILNADIPLICIENPAKNYLVTRYGYPYTQKIQHNQFGANYIKATGLWLKGLKTLQPTNVQPVTVTNWMKWETRGDVKKRQRTFPGIAAAMAEQWG